MGSFTCFYLIIWFGLTNISHSESKKGITKNGVLDMCRSPNCTRKSSIQFFCQHVYEKVFKCDTTYRPLKLICDGISHCKNGIDEDQLVCSYLARGKSSVRADFPKLYDWDKNIIGPRPDCGVIREATITPLILNGRPIRPNLWPWYSALFTFIGAQWKFFCSSSIIASNAVITAAHCVWNMPKEYIKVAAGKTFSDLYLPESSSQIRDVQTILVHPLYEDSIGNYRSDVAIIKLTNQFFFTEFVLPICLNRTLRNVVRKRGTPFKAKVIGMGITENGTISNELRFTDVEILSDEDCLRNQRFEFRKYVTVASFCAVGKADGVVCNGDSGSGLAIKNETTGKWFLEGIVSISPKNPNDILCDKKYYSIYTNVGMYSDWIYEHFNEN